MVINDVLIKNGTIIDGSGKQRYKADIDINDGKIVEIGNLTENTGNKVINAKGLFVSPGFIDNHAHSDWTIFVHPNGDSKVMQGVTTELNGLCGYASAPLNKDEWYKLLYVRMTVGWSMHYAAAAYNSWPLPYGKQVEVDWSTMAEYLDRVEETRVGLNYAMLFGHSSIRYYIMGLESRVSDKDELEKMKDIAEQALKDGAIGMSSGLSGCPGCWSDTNEIIELCEIVKKFDGVYMPHLRSSYKHHAIEEIVEIAEKSGVRTCMSHTRLVQAGAKNLLDEARARGVDITFDTTAYPGSIAGNIVGMLPHWLNRHRENGFDFIIEQLKKPEIREQFIHKDYPKWRTRALSVTGKRPYKPKPGELEPNWSGMQVQKLWTRQNQSYIGMTFDEIARVRGVDPWTAWFDLVCEEKGYVRWLNFHADLDEMHYQALEDNLRVPYITIESDGPIESPRGVSITSVDPRSYGSFPLILGEYVRKRNVLTWEDAIMKMTLNPAKTMGLNDRGLIKEGYWGDVVIFDPETVAHKATFKNCLELSQGINHDVYPEGIIYTIVNGVVVVKKGKLTGARPGQVIRNKVK
jgi:N-acyl-D-amino-acid deacylase